MATEKHYTGQIVDDGFNELENNNEEGIRMTKRHYENLITKFRFAEDQNGFGGFEVINMIENCLESFLHCPHHASAAPIRGKLNKTLFWSTLIQKTNPKVRNPKHYFNRPFQYFKDGFGYPNLEFCWVLNTCLN